MAGAQFEYDEKGTTFYYFLISFFGIVLVPVTYYVWKITKLPDDQKRAVKICRCPPCVEKRELLRKKEPKSKSIRYASLSVLAVLWVLFFVGAYKISQFEKDFTEYDPYAVLELDRGATTADIRRQYRRLSMKYHPDKDTGDPQKFMRIAKAYEALTNEESRKNWEEHGNPDGPGATSFGIALPSWLVSKENSMWVLGAYGLAFMVILPIAVGTWWYKSIQYSCEQILLDTTQLYYYFFHKTPTMQTKRVLMILAGSLEFEKGHNNDIQERPSDNIELPELMRDLPNLGDKNKEPPLCYPYSIKARALIHAHLSRLELPRITLKTDLDLVLQKSPFLIQEMVNCVGQLIAMAKAGRTQNMPRLETLENCMRVSQMVIQGLWDNKSPLLQLPHLNQENLRHFNTKKRSVRSIRQLASMKDEDRRSLLRNLTGEQYEDVINVCSMFPVIDMVVKPHVLDDEDDAGLITTGSIVTVSVTVKRRNLGEFFEEDDLDDLPPLESVHPNDTMEPKGSPQAGGQKVWQKNKKKGKKAKPQKQQPKKKPVKQQPKKKTSQEEKEKTHEEKEEPSGKKNKNKATKREEDEDKEEEDEEDVEMEKEEADEDEEDEDDAEEEETNDKIEEIKKPKRKPDQDESDLDSSSLGEDEDSDAAQEDASARESEDEAEWDRLQADVKGRDPILDPKSKESHIVHAPYFPEEKQEWWWIYVTDRRKIELITPPQQIFNLKEEEKVDLRFQAPHKAKTYHYTVTLRSDSYLDFDVHQNFNINVEEAKEVKTKQWDFDSDDEDKDDIEESGESEEEEYSD
ncbi:translocation protein SEC63 homolog [Orbicella faveolata]|uniref:translocation protein SEC63 homolog n=1 Tax=Orbicella faveolata TaxID=48498 RepID=UPI0009E63E1B|nr:translocation protein SEC63 homolog [Orbicella faveolata]